MKSTDKERKEITRSLVESISKVVEGKQLDEFSGYDDVEHGLPYGLADDASEALDHLNVMYDSFFGLEDKVKDVKRNFRSEKIKLKKDPTASVSALKKAWKAVERDLKATIKQAEAIDKKNR